MKRSFLLLVVVAGVAACNSHSFAPLTPRPSKAERRSFPQAVDKKVDILFVIDNSLSMSEEQTDLAAKFDQLIDNLWLEEIKDLPDLHIGVVSTEVDRFGDCSELNPSRTGVLISDPSPGCTAAPRDPWIQYTEDGSNIDGAEAPASDPLGQVKEAFRCIARLGVNGCGWEQPLQAAKSALNPAKNPGFLRDDALLVVVIITDEDDCSARREKAAQLFGQDAQTIEQMGPVLVRCVEHGYRCTDKAVGGYKHRRNCVLDDSYLHDPQEYVDFLTQLKHGQAERVIVSVIAGKKVDEIAYQPNEHGNIEVASVCGQGGFGAAAPALRLKAFADAFGANGVFSNICEGDFGPALSHLARRIVATIGAQCLNAPPLDRHGQLVCAAGDTPGEAMTCDSNTLAKADCVVSEEVGGVTTSVARCPAALFDGQAATCQGDCPCWRLAPRPEQCSTADGGAPYAIEILRESAAEVGTTAKVECYVSGHRWGSPALDELQLARP